MGIITDIFKLLFMPVYVIYKIIVAVLFVGVLSLFFGGCAPAGMSEDEIAYIDKCESDEKYVRGCLDRNGFKRNYEIKIEDEDIEQYKKDVESGKISSDSVVSWGRHLKYRAQDDSNFIVIYRLITGYYKKEAYRLAYVSSVIAREDEKLENEYKNSKEYKLAVERKKQREEEIYGKFRNFTCIDILNYATDDYNACLYQTGSLSCRGGSQARASEIVKSGYSKCKDTERNRYAINFHLNTSANLGFRTWQDIEQAKKIVGRFYAKYLTLDFDE